MESIPVRSTDTPDLIDSDFQSIYKNDKDTRMLTYTVMACIPLHSSSAAPETEVTMCLSFLPEFWAHHGNTNVPGI